MITPKLEKFCLEYLATGNASEAYRRAMSKKQYASVLHYDGKQAAAYAGKPVLSLFEKGL